MRCESTRFRGFGPFRDEVHIDLAGIAGVLVAVVGPNGAGKTTLLELMLPGAAYRETPTRGKLAALATERDSFIESRVVNGAAWTIRQTVDHDTGRGESLVLGDDGQPALASTKLKEYDTWSAAHLPAREVFYSSIFAAQQSGGFLDMKPAERKAVVLRVLGVERLEALADLARQRVRGRKAETDTLQARLDDERARSVGVDTAQNELAQAQGLVELAGTNLAAARKALAEAEAQAQAVAEAEREHQIATEKRAELRAALEREQQKLADAERKIANNRRVLDDHEAIEAAVAHAAELDEQIPALRIALADAERAEREARDEARRQRDELTRAQGLLDAARGRRQLAEVRAKGADDVRAAVESLPRLREALADAEEAERQAEAAAEAVHAERLSGAEDRIQGLRGGLREILDGTEDPVGVANDTLIADDQAVAAAEDHPRRMTEADETARDARIGVNSARGHLEAAERVAARLGDLEAAERDLAALDTEIAEHRAALAALDARTVPVVSDVEGPAVVDARGELAHAQTERQRLEPQLALAPRLAEATARIEVLTPQVETAQLELSRLEGELAATPEPVTPPPRAPALAPPTAEVEQREREERAAHAAVAVAERRLVDARAAAERIGELGDQLEAAWTDLADWKRLAEDLGRDGLQAMIIDAAGGEITTLCNDLLHAAFGSRFTVSLETTRLSADGKTEIESFEVTVLDTERGREARAETLSGGERVIISEALSLALTMVACRRAGVERPSLVRDESGAALDPEKAAQYVAMLRRAAGIVGADKVLLVSHSPDVPALCDARLEVRDGRVTVEA